jgi:hypothetical protein
MTIRFRLASIGGVAGELRRLYRMCHDAKMTWQDAYAASRILREIRTCIEGSELEARIAAIEQALGRRAPGTGYHAPGNGNGHDLHS